jgi:hypothetical protein
MSQPRYVAVTKTDRVKLDIGRRRGRESQTHGTTGLGQQIGDQYSS